MRKSNPPWADSILKAAYPAIQAAAPKSALPIPEERIDQSSGRKKIGWREYGTGHYGTVYPTNSPGLVMKLTSDPTEAAFVAAYLSLPARNRSNGIVNYHAVYRVPGVLKSKRPVFVIWRDEAVHVGIDALERWVHSSNNVPYHERSLRHVAKYLNDAKTAANKIRTLLKKSVTTASGARRRELLIERFTDEFTMATSEMQNEPLGNYVGEAMSMLLDQGLLLADVHTGNIGMPTGDVEEQIGETCIITDPGHAVALDDRFAGVTIKDLV